MNLVVPVEFVPVKQNGQFCADGGSPDFELVSMTPAIQMTAMTSMPAAKIPSFSGLPAPLQLSVTQRIGLSTDELGLSKPAVVQHNIRTIQTNSSSSSSFPFSSSSTSKYMGLPYQDHNYVQLPPSTPPQSPSSLSFNVPITMMVPKSNLSIDDISYQTTVITTPDDSITRCICEFQHDDGYMIQCDKCGVWQHVDCMEVDRNNIPESYMCELCEPRKVDKHKAIQIQTNKRDALSLLRVDSSATETEDETMDGRRRSMDKSPLKREHKEVLGGPGGGTGIGALTLTKKRKSRSKRDERLKRKLHIKRQTNGQQRLSISSPRKTHFDSVLMIDGFGEPVRQEVALPQNGALVMPVSSLNSRPAGIEIYQDAVSNRYTVELQNLLASIKFNGQQGPACSLSVYESLQLRPPSCLPASINNTKMCLEACEDILTNQPLIEYIGNVMLRDQYDRDGLFYLRSEPNVLFYSKLGGLDLCIDASLHGNIARYVRRSCTPNAEVRHVLEGSTVRFFLCATKSIVRGAEITIPFDFNYHKCGYAVDCACTRISCPVAKFQRREASHSSGPTARRQRSARSLDVTLTNQENAMLSSKKLPLSSLFPAPSLASSILGAARQSKMPALGSLKPEPAVEIEISKTEIKMEPVPVKLEPLSPTRQLPGTPVAMDTSFPVSSASAVVVSSSTAVASDAEESDKSKKKTREEKKLEAVMKMFERLEKQQERKKEAQSRHEQGRGKEVTKAREARKSKDKTENKSISETMCDTKQSIADTASSFPEQVTTSLPDSAVKVEPKPRVKRTKHAAASRRTSMSRAVHTATETVHPPVSVLGSNDGLPSPGLDFPASTVVADASVSSVYLSNPSALETATSLLALSAERWTGYPKKLMMKGQDLHKQLTIKTDGLETSSNSEGDSGKEFVQCVPSPHSCSLNALRRNSMPAFGTSNGTVGASSRTALLATAPAVNGADSKGCSAKKRWLQQAMCDKTELRPIGEETVSGNGLITNMSNSPTDFVTPLKKRRLARESLSMESPPLSVQQDDSTCTSVMFPLYESISDDDHVDVEVTQSGGVKEATNDIKPEGVGIWNVSLLSNQADIVSPQKTERPASESGLLRVQLPASVNSQPNSIHPEMFLLMQVGFQCPTGGDGRPTGSAIPRSGGITSASNGYGVGVELAGAHAWQKTSPESAASAANSGLIVGGHYRTATAATGYLSNLVPGVQKQDSLNVPGLLDYQMAFSGIQSAYNGPRNGPGGPMAPLSAGLGSGGGAGIPGAVYLTKQVAGPNLNSEAGGAGYPMSLFHTVTAPNCDVQGIMALAEAACRSRERTAETKAQTGDAAQMSTHCDTVRDVVEASSDTLYAFTSSANSDLDAKRRGCFSTTQAGFVGGAQNSDRSHALSLHGDTVLVSNPSALDGASIDHAMPRENGTSLVTLWRETPAGNDSNNATPVKYDSANYLFDIPGFDTSVAASSPSLSSPTSTAGLCTSKKKVSLHEYKMRRKSGSTGQGHMSSGSGSALDSDVSPSLSYDAAMSPLNRSMSNAVSPDVSRDLSEGLSLAWSSNATEAERALENLTSGEKLFRIDKGNVADTGPSPPSCKLLNRTLYPSEPLAVQSATSAPVEGVSTTPGSVVMPTNEGDGNQPDTLGDVLDRSSAVAEDGETQVLAATSADDCGTAETQNVQASNFSSKSSGSSLIQC